MARKRRLGRPRWARLAVAAILGAHCLLYWVLTTRKIGTGGGGPAAGVHDDTVAVRPAAIRAASRSIYPYSVIRGGAYSAEELDHAVRSDPVVATHYAGFDRMRVHLTGAPEGADVYVSYRQGDRVYWTRRKLHLAAGEPLLSDGVLTARARCGNRISMTPQEPWLAIEPAGIDTDLPVAPDGGVPEVFGAPLVVHEIFPAPIRSGVPGIESGGVPGGDVGTPAFQTATGGGMRVPGPEDDGTPQLPGAGPTNAPVMWPSMIPVRQVADGRVWSNPWSNLSNPPVWFPGGPGGATGSTGPAAGGVRYAPTAGAGIPGASGGVASGGDPGGVARLPGGLSASPDSGPPPKAALAPSAPGVEIPEPGVCALLVCGAAALAARRWREWDVK